MIIKTGISRVAYLVRTYLRLRGKYLAGARLKEANLKGANLKGANLNRVDYDY